MALSGCLPRAPSIAFGQRSRDLWVALLLAATIAGCSDERAQQIADLRNQVAARDRELTELRSKHLESVKNEAQYKGTLDALKPRLEEDLKTTVAMCNRGADAGTEAALTRLRASCDATNEKFQNLMAGQLPPPPTQPPKSNTEPAPPPKQDAKPQADVPAGGATRIR
jgi:hypothetical protein